MSDIPEGYEIVNDIPQGYELVGNGTPQPMGFTDRIKQDYANRLQNNQKIAEDYVAGNLSYPSALLQFGGQGAAFSGDIGLEGLKSIGKGISSVTPDFIEEPIKRGVAHGLDYVMDTPVGRFASDAANYALQKYQNIEQKYPVATRNAEALANIGLSLAPSFPIKGKSLVGAAESLAKEGIESGFETLASLGGKINTKKVYPTADEIKAASRNLYREGEELGATFDPKVIDDVIKTGNELSPKGEVAKSLIKPDDADNFIASLQQVGHKNLTLDDFESLDRHLGDKAHASFLSDPALSRKYSMLQGALRESVENPFNIIGSDAGIKAQREATRLWSIGTKMNDIERVIKDAQYYEVPSTAIKTGFRRIARNDKLMRGYTGSERAAIERAAKSGSLDGIFKTFGSRLMAIGGASVGGVPGAMLGYGISEGGRAAAEAIKTGQAGVVAKQLGERSGLVRNEKRLSAEALKQIKE